MPRLLPCLREHTARTSDSGLRLMTSCLLTRYVDPDGGTLFRKNVRHSTAGVFRIKAEVNAMPRQIRTMLSYGGRSHRCTVRTTLTLQKDDVPAFTLKGPSVALNSGTVNDSFGIPEQFRSLEANTVIRITVDVTFNGVFGRDGKTSSSNSHSGSNSDKESEEEGADNEATEDEIDQDHAVFNSQHDEDQVGRGDPSREFNALFNAVVFSVGATEPRDDEREEDVESVWGDLNS